MKRSLLILTWALVCNAVGATDLALLERMGFSRDAKLLIIHADDVGLSHGQNLAAIRLLESGVVTSASLMVPCPWFPEIAAYAESHPERDFGLHLTLYNDWKYYRWGPVGPLAEVSSLISGMGYFFDDPQEFARRARPSEVEREVRAQIERARQFGVKLTHLDSHRFCMYRTPEIFQICLKVAREYGLPTLLHRARARSAGIDLAEQIREDDIIVDDIYMARPDDFAKGLRSYYLKVFTSLRPGLNVLLMHPAYDDEEMRGITVDHPNFGAAWRQQDVDFFSSDECRKLIRDAGIQLVSWGQISARLRTR